jgi:hypothetical protein
MATKFEKRNLYKLILARDDITNALFISQYFLKNVKSIKDELWLSLQEAIVISYGRPFSKNKPFGQLPKAYSEMPNKAMQLTHELLLEARDKEIAHSDADRKKVFIVPIGARMPQGGLASGVGIATKSSRFSVGFFEKVEQLCLYVGRKIHFEIEKELERLYGNVKGNDKIQLEIDKDD